MKKALTTTSIVLICLSSFAAYRYWNFEKAILKSTSGKNEKKYIAFIKQTESKIYTNDKLGFTFQYINDWVQNGKEVEIHGRNGKTTAMEVRFIDTIYKTSLLIIYHFAPNGNELYNYSVSEFDSTRGDKVIRVAGNKAIRTYTKISKDGKGNTLNPPFGLIVVKFLNGINADEIELQFKTRADNNENTEVMKFNQLLESFKVLSK
jgi:hypothetical protein